MFLDMLMYVEKAFRKKADKIIPFLFLQFSLYEGCLCGPLLKPNSVKCFLNFCNKLENIYS